MYLKSFFCGKTCTLKSETIIRLYILVCNLPFHNIFRASFFVIKYPFFPPQYFYSYYLVITFEKLLLGQRVMNILAKFLYTFTDISFECSKNKISELKHVLSLWMREPNIPIPTFTEEI